MERSSFLTQQQVGAITAQYSYAGCAAGAWGQVCKVTRPQSLDEEFDYTEAGSLVLSKKGDYQVEVSVNHNGDTVQIEETVDPGQIAKATFKVDQDGFVMERRLHNVETGASSKDLVWVFEPDVMRRVSKVVEPNADETLYTYDHSHRTMTVATGSYVKAYSYDENSNVVSTQVGTTVSSLKFDGPRPAHLDVRCRRGHSQPELQRQ